MEVNKEMKMELKRSIRKIFKDTKKEDVKFEVIFCPETVEDTLKLKELEFIRRNKQRDGFYQDKWEEMKFIILLS